jgi:hypothetical protein
VDTLRVAVMPRDGAIIFRDVSVFNADVIREKLYIKVVGVS